MMAWWRKLVTNKLNKWNIVVFTEQINFLLYFKIIFYEQNRLNSQTTDWQTSAHSFHSHYCGVPAKQQRACEGQGIR